METRTQSYVPFLLCIRDIKHKEPGFKQKRRTILARMELSNRKGLFRNHLTMQMELKLCQLSYITEHISTNAMIATESEPHRQMLVITEWNLPFFLFKREARYKKKSGFNSVQGKHVGILSYQGWKQHMTQNQAATHIQVCNFM